MDILEDLNSSKDMNIIIMSWNTPLNSIIANNARQTKDNYRFTVDNSSEANQIDWYNAYLEAETCYSC